MYLLFVLICTIAIQTFKRTLCAMLHSTHDTVYTLHNLKSSYPPITGFKTVPNQCNNNVLKI